MGIEGEQASFDGVLQLHYHHSIVVHIPLIMDSNAYIHWSFWIYGGIWLYVKEQAVKRIRGIGQTKTVSIKRFIIEFIFFWIDELYIVACSPTDPTFVAIGDSDDKEFMWRIGRGDRAFLFS